VRIEVGNEPDDLKGEEHRAYLKGDGKADRYIAAGAHISAKHAR
jgi:hypothetical protein